MQSRLSLVTLAVSDPDGNPRKVAWNPNVPPDEQGHLFLPDQLT